ncbi:unnamed protein product [Closterium sp. NIES-54]
MAPTMRNGAGGCGVLDKSWDNLIPTLNTQQDQWTPEWLQQQILQEDFRRRHTGGAAANKTAEGYGAAGGSRGRGGGRGRGRGRGFGRGRGRGDYNEGHGSSGGRGSTRMEGACWYCKKAGHPWFKCFSRPGGWAPPGMKPPSGERAPGGAVQGSGAQGDGAHGKADLGMFLMVEDVKGSEGDVGSVGKVVMHPLTHWVIDSGCTSHMTPRADLLDEVKPPGKIKFVAAASDALLPVIGVGNAKKSKARVTFGPTSCRAKLGKLLLWDLEEKSSCIKDLWQLPIIPWNGKLPATAAAAATAATVATAAPAATGKATAGGEETAPSDGALDAVKKVQQPQQPHGEVLAGVDATAAWANASSGSGEADWETWHERLCHMNFPMLQKLVKDESLKGLEVKGAVKEIGSCPTCLETKFSKFPFSSGMGPAKAPLVLVHMDVVGPTRAPSLSGSRYFLTIVDDHTRAMWVYPLKTKGEVAAAVLKEWMPRAQRESRHKVKVIRTDNRGEFIGTDFEAVLKKKGIQHQLTVPYNPQQNGVAERFNRTLIKQMDITTAFLNGIILEELYMLQPKGLDDGSGRVCRLKKAIHGLKQAPCAWYHKLEETLLAGGFKKSECDHSLFLLQEKEQFLMLLVYVDHILLFSESSAMIEHAEEMLEMQFKCSKMGDVKYYLGMHVERDLDKGVLRLH